MKHPALLCLQREPSTRKPEALSEDGWVVAISSGQRILWLPPEHRPAHCIILQCIKNGNMTIRGTDKGYAHFYGFQLDADLT